MPVSGARSPQATAPSLSRRPLSFLVCRSTTRSPCSCCCATTSVASSCGGAVARAVLLGGPGDGAERGATRPRGAEEPFGGGRRGGAAALVAVCEQHGLWSGGGCPATALACLIDAPRRTRPLDPLSLASRGTGRGAVIQRPAGQGPTRHEGQQPVPRPRSSWIQAPVGSDRTPLIGCRSRAKASAAICRDSPHHAGTRSAAGASGTPPRAPSTHASRPRGLCARRSRPSRHTATGRRKVELARGGRGRTRGRNARGGEVGAACGSAAPGAELLLSPKQVAAMSGPPPVPWPPSVNGDVAPGQRRVTCTCHCAACDSHFSSLDGFDAHRAGDHGAGTRRCLVPGSVDRLVALSGDAACRLGGAKPQTRVTVWTLGKALARARRARGASPQAQPGRA
jgi:hypothetical protein